MADGAIDLGADAWTQPLDTLDPAQPELFEADAHWPYFERLRAEDPVHFTPGGRYGPYWSVTRWSEVATAVPGHGVVETWERKVAELQECFAYFTRLWNERVNAPPAGDLISMLAHGEHTRNMTPREYRGNVLLLIVGGNDTTRNTITGSVLALNQNPDQYAKLREHPELIPSMVSETIRWQTPLAHMRRTATRDTELGGKRIAKGDKVIMW